VSKLKVVTDLNVICSCCIFCIDKNTKPYCSWNSEVDVNEFMHQEEDGLTICMKYRSDYTEMGEL